MSCGSQPEQGLMAWRLHTHIPPQAWAFGQRQGFAPQGSHPTAQMMHGRDLNGEKKVGGRRIWTRLLPPSLFSTLCKHSIFPMSAGGGKTPPAGAQGWMCVWAGIAPQYRQPQAHDPDCALLAVSFPHAVPSRTPPRASPLESPPNQGHLSAPSWP